METHLLVGSHIRDIFREDAAFLVAAAEGAVSGNGDIFAEPVVQLLLKDADEIVAGDAFVVALSVHIQCLAEFVALVVHPEVIDADVSIYIDGVGILGSLLDRPATELTDVPLPCGRDLD